MHKNKIISISIPTYNRADALDLNLAHHVPIAAAYGIEILIFDNASIDHTEAVVRKWKKKYELLSYYRNEKNIGFDGNFELALTRPETDYIWLLGDSYSIQKEGIDEILADKRASLEFDLYVFNLDERMTCKSDVYRDHNRTLLDLSGVISCVSCSVLSRNLVRYGRFSNYRGTNFVHTGVILDYISRNPFRLKWNKELSVHSVRIDHGDNHWTRTGKALQIGLDGWAQLIFSLPSDYSPSNKLKALKNFGKVSGMLRWRFFLTRRASGLFSLQLLNTYQPLLNASSKSIFNILAIYLVTSLPVRVARPLADTLQKIKTATCKKNKHNI